MDDDEYNRIVDPAGPPLWLGLLSEQQKAWRANEILRGRNPDPYIEERLKEAKKWPPKAKHSKQPAAFASEPALDPYVALDAIRTFAKVALGNDEPTERAYELVMREILQAAEMALSGRPKPD